jgi:hypothetical protein
MAQGATAPLVLSVDPYSDVAGGYTNDQLALVMECQVKAAGVVLVDWSEVGRVTPAATVRNSVRFRLTAEPGNVVACRVSAVVLPELCDFDDATLCASEYATGEVTLRNKPKRPQIIRGR